MARSQALAFIKPHVMNVPAVVELVESRLIAAGIAIELRRELDGAAVARGGFIDRHYAANARVGLCQAPSMLPVSAAARARFGEVFHESWETVVAAGRAVSGEVMRQRLGEDAETLNRRWAGQTFHKLAGGLYVALFAAENVYVLNGFYPSARAVFTAPEARLRLLLLTFDALRLPWRRFRDGVIGATNPAVAEPASIRGELYRRQGELGLSVTYRENVIHASASAFESLAEQVLWLPDRPPDDDPLWALLRKRGVTLEQVESWRVDNPLVTLSGKSGSLLDALENHDASACDRMLDEFLRRRK
ncbi:MAG: nucleoside-diphosphate kinase [Kiritimatiellae bacterium]|nr:nucleoside-diphosphate kinase [Kiritimatiellia bacterium]